MASKGIKDRVAIVGMGCTKFGEHWDKGAEDLLVDAAYEAYESAGVSPDDVDAYWLGTMGSGISGLTLVGAAQDSVQAGHPRREHVRDRFRGAAPGLLCGRVGRVRHGDGDRRREAQGLGLLGPGDDQSAQRRHRRQHDAAGARSRCSRRRTSRSTASTRTRARTCSRASPGRTIATARRIPRRSSRRKSRWRSIKNSPKIADPLGIMDCSGVSDGSAAAIVVRAEDAHKYCKNPIYIKALSFVAGPAEGPLSQEYDFTTFREVVASAQGRLRAGRHHQSARADQHGGGPRLLHADRAGADGRPRLQPARDRMAGRDGRLLRPRRASCRSIRTAA